MKKFANLKSIEQWFNEPTSLPLIIAGPCSVESYEQVIQTAEKLSNIPQVKIFRAGVWKPRTNPNDFEGVGNIAIEWLSEIKQKFNLSIAVEVLSPKHVEICLSKNIDILWLGTRTVSNPFSVQQIADALKGTDAIVLVKNPLNPDLKLWIGAIERIYKSGITKLAAVHRGFYPFEPTNLRNIPKWEITIDLRTQFSNLPIICDPSHIAGHTRYISMIAQKAMDLCYDGLMIESHINPKEALSDSKQQLTPSELLLLLKRLIICNNKNVGEQIELLKLREKIDSIDMQLLELLHYRMEIVKELSTLKKQHQLPILQLERWREIIHSRLKKAKELNMNTDFIKALLEIIHLEAIRIQSEKESKD